MGNSILQYNIIYTHTQTLYYIYILLYIVIHCNDSFQGQGPTSKVRVQLPGSRTLNCFLSRTLIPLERCALQKSVDRSRALEASGASSSKPITVSPEIRLDFFHFKGSSPSRKSRLKKYVLYDRSRALETS